MRTLGASGGWLFFEHAGAAVAVDITSGDVTDVFSVRDLNGHAAWAAPGHTAEERRAALLARSALATNVDSLQTFRVPEPVRASARQAQQWIRTYQRPIELPIVAAGTSLVPPISVRQAAHAVIDADLDHDDIARAEHLASGRSANPEIVHQMVAYFARHAKEKVDPQIWASWGGDAGRVWANKVAQAADRDASTVSQKLAEDETIDYDALRLLPRAFSMLSGPHTAECDGNGACSCGGSKSSARYPSARALTYLALGGDVGRDWAQRTIRRVEAEALLATGYDADANVVVEDEVPEAESFDGTVPHVYAPTIENPEYCTYCGSDELDERHQADAVDYDQADITPEDAHYFSEVVNDPDTCEICGKAVDDTLHKQAALADYYQNKNEIDQKITETQEYWAGKGEGEQPAEPVTAAAEIYGVDWEEVDPLEQAISAEDDLNTLFWRRRGTENQDPLTYYAAHTGHDQMLVDQLYVSDGAMFYVLDPRGRTWVQTTLDSPEQIYEIDDDAARDLIRAMSVYPDRAVDLREIDPGEAMLMAECLPALENDPMLDQLAVVTATGVFAPNDGYTPEERSENAKRQVRDANGRFAKKGSRVAVGGRSGYITGVNRDRQQIAVKYDNGEHQWVNARDVRIDPKAPREQVPEQQPHPSRLARAKAAFKATLKKMRRTLPKPQVRQMVSDFESVTQRIHRYRRGLRDIAGTHESRKERQQRTQFERKLRDDYRSLMDGFLEAGWDRAGFERDWDRRQTREEKRRAERRKQRRADRRPTRTVISLADEAADAPEDAPEAGEPITDPDQSDIPPIYMAEVDEANQAAVLELLAMVPTTTDGGESQVLRYTAGGWVSDPKILRQLKSSAPPAIVSLDEAAFKDTLTQVQAFYQTPEGKAEAEAEAKQAASQVASAVIYGEYGELLAAGVPGVADAPSDIAAVERLKRYWGPGEGGAKIGWNTPGDMTRCMKYLRKYMPKPDMHAGYCAKLHHQMTGTWPGDRRNIGRAASAAERGGLFDTHLFSTDEIIAYSAIVAAADAVCAGVEAPADVSEVPTELTGAPFRIPILAPVGVKSGDGRHFAPLSLTMRDLPLPLMWQIQTAEGHDDSVIVGRIDSIDQAEDGSLVNARGVFDVGPYGQEAERLVRHKFLRGVSVDLDNFEAEARNAETRIDEAKSEKSDDEVIKIHADDMTVTNGRVMGATLVAKPAFQEVSIELEEGQEEEEPMVADGTYIGTPDTEAETEEMIRSALTAAGIPIHPPEEWFADPELKKETPLTVLDDGRVYGHVATWDSEHIGLPFSTRPPRSRSDYAYFHTGLLRTAEGNDVPVGQVTLAGGHASLESDAAMAVKHYDDTASAFCDVHAGEDAHGIWVAGALRPNVTAEQVRAIRAAAPSGDWRPINGRLEMVAVCQVNVPGFPVTRARVASGHVYALVAAGTATLARIRSEMNATPLDKLMERMDALEAPQRAALEEARAAALARFNPVRQEHAARLAQAREAALSRFNEQRSPEATAVRKRMAELMSGGEAELFRDIGTDKRKELAKKGAALPDGSYPISTVGDLKNAIRAYGRAKESDRAKVKRHIKKRARALGKTDLIPESWNSVVDPFSDLAGEINDLAARLAMVSGATTVPIILHGDETVLDNANLLAAGGRYPDGTPWKPENHPRDEKGKFRQVIAELKGDLEGEAGTEGAIEGLKDVEAAAGRGDTEAAQQAARDVLDLVDQMAGATKDEDLVKTLREGYGSLAEAVANLPLIFGDLNEKYRFTDLPDDLQSLIKDLYARAETRLDNEHLAEAGGKLNEFMAGGDVLSQPQISAELSRILRFLI